MSTAIITATSNSKIIKINRNRFNPEFIGIGWTVIPKETDARAAALTELDVSRLKHVLMVKDGEINVTGEERLKRLKNSNYIRLDADVFITLWENQHLIPESWKEKVDGKIRYILFNGTVLSDLRGNRNILYLCWRDARWRCGVCWLALDWDASRLSAVLES